MPLRNLQSILFGLAALLALPAHAAESVATGSGMLQGRSSVDFQVFIPAVMRLALFNHPAMLQVTAEDSAAGEVRVDGADVLVVANHPRGYTLQAELAPAFAEAAIEGLAMPVQIRAGGSSVAMPSMVGQVQPQPKRVQYRFRLAKGTAPGVYPWPLALSLTHP
jgi:hypothetical protein